jgi:hypothetical protein
MFLMNKHHIPTSGIFSSNGKHHIATSGVISSVVGDMFHGAFITDGVHKV